jgi:hypothetical protein
MRRFTQNRWLSFILVLGFLMASPVSSAFAGTAPDPIEYGGGGGSGSDPGGDPDGTGGGGSKKGPGYGRVSPGRYVSIYAGDVDRTSSAWMWRLHVVLRSLTSRLFGF